MTDEKIIQEFTALKGVGEAKAQLLIDKGFDSMEKLRKATKQQLTSIKGISEANAQDILDQVKQQRQTPPSKKPKDSKKPTSQKQKPLEKPQQTQKQPTKPKQQQSDEATPSETTEEEEDVEIIEETKEVKVKKKPTLSPETRESLEKRKAIKKRTPKFLREEWFRYKRIPKNWRRPDGLTSSMRQHKKYRPNVVSIGYRGPKQVRGLHASGFEEVIVHNVADLNHLNPATQAARISGTVGTKKRMDIAKKAEELDVRILNPGV